MLPHSVNTEISTGNNGGMNMSGSEVDEAMARLRVSDPRSEPSRLTMRITSPDNAVYKDVTADFTAHTTQLKVGQLVQCPRFTLFEAVGALEIMDPKMDSGMRKPGENDMPFDVLQPILPEEVIGIMDQLLAMEMSWHNGGALSQTVFTCLYIDRLLSSTPKTLQQAQIFKEGQSVEGGVSPGYMLVHLVLRAYCLGLVKCCDYVNRQILLEHIYEEEDFVTQTYNVTLLENIPVERFYEIMNEALLYLDSSNSSWPTQVVMALKARLMFRKQFLAELARDPREMLTKGANWDACISLLATVGVTRNHGKPVPHAFSTSVQRKLASTVPPRPMVITPFEEAFTTLSKLCKDAKEILRIGEYKGATNLMTFFLRFTARKPLPCAYVRSLLQTLLFNNGMIFGSINMKQLLFDDVCELCLPADDILDELNFRSEAPQDPRFQIARRLEWFLERAGQSYLVLYRTICQNRARFRRNLCHSIVDWDSLQLECEEVDAELRGLIQEQPQLHNDQPSYAFSLSSWVYHYKLRQMEYIIFLGFELDIYLPYEFAGMFWYLQYFLRTRLQHLERIRQFVHPEVSPMSMLARTRSPSARASEATIANTVGLVNFTLLEAAALQELCSALIYMYNAMYRLKLIKKPPQPYSTDQLRYELRMKPFVGIGTPEVIPFSDFQSLISMSDVLTEELLEQAAESTKECRRNFDLLQKMSATTSRSVLCEDGYKLNIREALRSCVGAGVAVALLLKAVKNNTVDEVHVEMDPSSYHPWFPVPRVTTKNTRTQLPALPTPSLRTAQP